MAEAASNTNSETLFREQAIKELSVQHLDARSLGAPVPLAATSLIVSLLTIIVLTTISTLPYAKKHRVVGQLDETATITLQATDYGHVSMLNVKEGDAVRNNQLLAKLSHRINERVGDSAELVTRLGQLQQAIHKNDRSLANQLDNLQKRKQQISMQISITRKRMSLQERKVNEMNALLSKTSELRDQGYVSNIDWLNLQTTLTTEKQKKFDIQEVLLQRQQETRSLDNEIKNAELLHEEKDIELSLEISRVRENLARINAEPYQLLKANADGIVSRVELAEGSTTKPGQVVLYVTKNNAAHTGTLMVPPIATRHLMDGDDMYLELESYPRESFGPVRAIVESIPQHTVMIGPSPFYPIRVKLLPSETIETYLPGMTITGDIVVERKSIALWIISPLQRLAGLLS